MKLEPGTILNGTDLSDVDFSELDLSGAIFDACTIVDANVSGTCFEGARFSKCSMIRSRFANVDFRDAIFEDCSFADDQGRMGAQFAFSRVEEGAFIDADLSVCEVRAIGTLWRGNEDPATFAELSSRRMDFGALGARSVQIGGDQGL